MPLNPKQRAFVNAYVATKNASKAALAAGYSPNGHGQTAHTLLKNPEIKKAIDKGLADLADKADISAERTIKRIASIAYHATGARNSDVLKACELLGKHFKLFTDQVALTAHIEHRSVVVLPAKKTDSGEDE